MPSGPLRDWSPSELIAFAAEQGPLYGCPPRLSVAAMRAEAGFDEFAERYGRETGYAKNLVALINEIGINTMGNWDGSMRPGMTGRQAWDELMGRVWPDVSFGPGQQIVLYAPVGDRSSSFENVMAVRDWLFRPENSVPLMLKKLGAFYQEFRLRGFSEDDAMLRALNRYNTGNLDGAPATGEYAGNQESYRRALAWAAAQGY